MLRHLIEIWTDSVLVSYDYTGCVIVQKTERIHETGVRIRQILYPYGVASFRFWNGRVHMVVWANAISEVVSISDSMTDKIQTIFCPGGDTQTPARLAKFAKDIGYRLDCGWSLSQASNPTEGKLCIISPWQKTPKKPVTPSLQQARRRSITENLYTFFNSKTKV